MNERRRWARRAPTMVLALFFAGVSFGCASSTPKTPDDLSGGRRSAAGGDSHAGTGGNTAPAAGSGAAPDCRGPGRYQSGKEGSYRPCCDGLNEVLFQSPARDSDNKPMCVDLPLRDYACIRGTCGDRMCEKPESDACGCVEDCLQATWDTLQSPDSAFGASTKPPASCSKQDVLESLQIADTAIDCGDLPLEPTREEEAKAIACVRDAIERNVPFQAFYHFKGEDRIVDIGTYATSSGAGELVSYTVVVDADWQGLHVPGASVTWWPCPLIPRSNCEGVPLHTCLACGTRGDKGSFYCGCLPNGDSVDVLCQQLPPSGPGL